MMKRIRQLRDRVTQRRPDAPTQAPAKPEATSVTAKEAPAKPKRAFVNKTPDGGDKIASNAMTSAKPDLVQNAPTVNGQSDQSARALTKGQSTHVLGGGHGNEHTIDTKQANKTAPNENEVTQHNANAQRPMSSATKSTDVTAKPAANQNGGNKPTAAVFSYKEALLHGMRNNGTNNGKHDLSKSQSKLDPNKQALAKTFSPERPLSAKNSSKAVNQSALTGSKQTATPASLPQRQQHQRHERVQSPPDRSKIAMTSQNGNKPVLTSHTGSTRTRVTSPVSRNNTSGASAANASKDTLSKTSANVSTPSGAHKVNTTHASSTSHEVTKPFTSQVPAQTVDIQDNCDFCVKSTTTCAANVAQSATSFLSSDLDPETLDLTPVEKPKAVASSAEEGVLGRPVLSIDSIKDILQKINSEISQVQERNASRENNSDDEPEVKVAVTSRERNEPIANEAEQTTKEKPRVTSATKTTFAVTHCRDYDAASMAGKSYAVTSPMDESAKLPTSSTESSNSSATVPSNKANMKPLSSDSLKRTEPMASVKEDCRKPSLLTSLAAEHRVTSRANTEASKTIPAAGDQAKPTPSLTSDNSLTASSESAINKAKVKPKTMENTADPTKPSAVAAAASNGRRNRKDRTTRKAEVIIPKPADVDRLVESAHAQVESDGYIHGSCHVIPSFTLSDLPNDYFYDFHEAQSNSDETGESESETETGSADTASTDDVKEDASVPSLAVTSQDKPSQLLNTPVNGVTTANRSDVIAAAADITMTSSAASTNDVDSTPTKSNKKVTFSDDDSVVQTASVKPRRNFALAMQKFMENAIAKAEDSGIPIPSVNKQKILEQQTQSTENLALPTGTETQLTNSKTQLLLKSKTQLLLKSKTQLTENNAEPSNKDSAYVRINATDVNDTRRSSTSLSTVLSLTGKQQRQKETRADMSAAVLKKTDGSSVVLDKTDESAAGPTKSYNLMISTDAAPSAKSKSADDLATSNDDPMVDDFQRKMQQLRQEMSKLRQKRTLTTGNVQQETVHQHVMAVGSARIQDKIETALRKAATNDDDLALPTSTTTDVRTTSTEKSARVVSKTKDVDVTSTAGVGQTSSDAAADGSRYTFYGFEMINKEDYDVSDRSVASKTNRRQDIASDYVSRSIKVTPDVSIRSTGSDTLTTADRKQERSPDRKREPSPDLMPPLSVVTESSDTSDSIEVLSSSTNDVIDVADVHDDVGRDDASTSQSTRRDAAGDDDDTSVDDDDDGGALAIARPTPFRHQNPASLDYFEEALSLVYCLQAEMDRMAEQMQTLQLNMTVANRVLLDMMQHIMREFARRK